MTTLQQALEQLRACEDELSQAIDLVGNAARREVRLPEVTDAGAMADLGRFGEAEPSPVVGLEAELAKARLELAIAQRRIRELELANRGYAERFGEVE
jgi:hypothetical protein